MSAGGTESIRPGQDWRRPVIVLVIAFIVAMFVTYRDSLSLETLVHQQDAVREATVNQPAMVYGSAFLIYVAVTGLSLPGAAIMSVVFGSLFGFWPAIALVSFASTTGATVAFLLSRTLFRDLILGRFGNQLTRFNKALARDGAFYLFTLRLIPHVPFFLVNLVMGLTSIRTSTFWWVSQLGMLPGTCVYVYAGASIGDLQVVRNHGVSGVLTWQLALAFALMGVFPVIAKRIVLLFAGHPTSPVSEELQ